MRPRPSLVLIGFMASGKSSVGRRCAEELRIPFKDSDRLIQLRARKSISAIFAEDGEELFRAMERDAIRTLSCAPPIVLATGGGAAMDPHNVAALRRTGYVVLLWVQPDEVVRRAGSRVTRPLLADAEDPAARVRELLSAREPTYRAAAHTVIDTTGLSVAESASRVLEAYRQGTAGRAFTRRMESVR